MSPLPRYWHQKIVLNIASAIREHLRNHRVGEVIISPSDVELTFEDVLSACRLLHRARAPCHPHGTRTERRALFGGRGAFTRDGEAGSWPEA